MPLSSRALPEPLPRDGVSTLAEVEFGLSEVHRIVACIAPEAVGLGEALLDVVDVPHSKFELDVVAIINVDTVLGAEGDESGGGFIDASLRCFRCFGGGLNGTTGGVLGLLNGVVDVVGDVLRAELDVAVVVFDEVG